MKEIKSNYNLTNFNLKFENEKIEDDYLNFSSNKLRKFNLYFSMGSFVVSFSYLVWTIFLLNYVTQYLQENFLSIKLIYTEDIPLYFNFTQVFYNKYIIVNSNCTDSSLNYLPFNSSLIFSGKSFDENKLIILRFIYTKKAIILCIVFCLIIFTLLTISKFTYKRKLHFLIFNFQFLFFGFMFHIFGANLLVFYNYTSDSMLFLVAFQMFFRAYMIHKSKISWINILLVCIFIAAMEWSLLFYVHYKIRTIHLLYLGVNDMILILCIILAYYSEYHNKLNFYFLKRLNFEKEYLLNFLHNMDEGFFTFKHDKILYVNKAMEEIVSKYSNISNKLKLEAVENCNSDSARKLSNHNLLNFITTNVFSDVKSETKIFLEKYLMNISELNKDLPVEILKLFDKKKQNENFIFDIENMYKLLINKENSNLSNFILLGVVDFKNFYLSQNKIINSNVTETFPKYQISFRIIENMEDNKFYLEMLFSDISRVTQNERKKTINDCRSLYLSKVAHEFKNPLVSLTELSENIKDASERENYKLEICSQVDHIKMICKIMENFLKDFAIFANLFENCADKKENCEYDALIICPACKIDRMCIKCKFCRKCEEIKKKTFNCTENIIKIEDIFNRLLKYEKKNIVILKNFSSLAKIENSCNTETYLNFINTNEEIFSSIIFNLVYYSYKNTFVGEIKILVESSDIKDVKICVIDTGLEIDPKFINKLENNQLTFEERSEFESDLESEISNFSNFNKYFGLYMASSQLRNIGSKLKIETSRFGNTFYFTLPIADKEHTLDKNLRNKIKKITQKSANSNMKMKVEITDKNRFSIKENTITCK